VTKASRRPLLEIGKYHRNARDAEAYVHSLFLEFEPGISLRKAKTGRLNTPAPGGETRSVSFVDAVQEARETGTVEPARSMLGHDPYFPLSFGIISDTKGATVRITSLYGDKVTMRTPLRAMAIHGELAGDILYHRKAACAGSAYEDAFRECACHLRSYYLACSAMVEVFLYRPVHFELQLQANPSEGLKRLGQPSGSFEERLELWVHEFCGQPFSTVKQTAEWSQLCELRRARNSIMHPPDVVLGIEVKDVARQLNLVRRGVGGFMNMLRKMQGYRSLAVADRLETAPEVRFVG